MRLAGSTIARIYRGRRLVEVFFKAPKQNPKIMNFVGVTPNALMPQIWLALIVMLLVRFQQQKSLYDWSLPNLILLLRTNMFLHWD